MDRCRVCYSELENPKDAFDEVYKQLVGEFEVDNPKAIIYSSDYDNFSFYSQRLSMLFPQAQIIGATSHVIFCSLGYEKKAFSVMAIYEGVEVATGVILDITKYPLRHIGVVKEAMSKLSSFENTICVEYTTSYSSSEELVQDTFREAFKDTPIEVYGGTASAAETIQGSYVSVNGTVYSEACVFMLIKNLNGRIGIYRENMFKPTKAVFTATEVNCDERIVYSYDDKPAAVVVAEALDVPVAELGEHLLNHPVGRVDGDNLYITEGVCVNDDLSIGYYARIYNYSNLVLLEREDLDTVWERTAQTVRGEIRDPSFTIVMNCYARSKYFLANGRFFDFTEKLKKEYGLYFGVVGLGEQMNFEHLNQTMLLAVFE